MKLLLDENLSRRLVPFLQHDFAGSSQVVLEGLASCSDTELWNFAENPKPQPSCNAQNFAGEQIADSGVPFDPWHGVHRIVMMSIRPFTPTPPALT
jgi:hypothetical protein